jgi:hypothetical protein
VAGTIKRPLLQGEHPKGFSAQYPLKSLAFQAAPQSVLGILSAKPFNSKEDEDGERQKLDEESSQYRQFKQLIERHNRTYKFHTRARPSFKDFNRVAPLTVVFVTPYNFFRPHCSLRYSFPVPLQYHLLFLHYAPLLTENINNRSDKF